MVANIPLNMEQSWLATAVPAYAYDASGSWGCGAWQVEPIRKRAGHFG